MDHTMTFETWAGHILRNQDLREEMSRPEILDTLQHVRREVGATALQDTFDRSWNKAVSR